MSTALTCRRPGTYSVPVNSLRYFHNLLKLLRSINFYKTLFTQAYAKWEEDSAKAVKLLKEMESDLRKYSKIGNSVKMGGEIMKVIGLGVALVEIVFLRSSNFSQICQNASKGLIGAGVVVEHGSQLVKNGLSKESCKKATRKMENLKESTEKLEREKKEYFRLLNEYECILDNMTEQQLRILYDCLEGRDLTDMHNELTADNLIYSAQENVPPLLSEMQRIRLDEETMNIPILDIRIIPKITDQMRQNPILRRIFEMKFRAIPQVNGENAVRAVMAAGNAYQGYDFLQFVGLLPGDCGLFSANRCAAGIISVLFLVDEIFSLVHTCSTLNGQSAAADEMRRVAEELNAYKERVRRSLKSTFDWECLQNEA